MILPAAHQQGNNCHYGSPATLGKHVSHIITACVCVCEAGGWGRGGPLISFDAAAVVFGEATLRQNRTSCQCDGGTGGQLKLLSSGVKCASRGADEAPVAVASASSTKGLAGRERARK